LEIFTALKSLENDHRYGKVCGKIVENCNADLKNAVTVCITLLITHAFVNFLAVHDTNHLKFKVKKIESHSVFRIEECIVKEIPAFKSKFCNVFVPNKDEKNALKSLEKEVILSWKSLENHSQIFLYEPCSCVAVLYDIMFVDVSGGPLCFLHPLLHNSVADLEGAEPAPPPPLWATDRRRHGTPDK